MASLDFINYEECENWFALAVSIAATVEGLQEFIRTRLKQIQDTVKLKHLGVPMCNPNKSCSVDHKNDYRNWCVPCQNWRNELKIYHKGNKSRTWDSGIKWDRINSCLWSRELEEIAKVFVNNNPESSVGLLYDLSSLLSIFRNCTQFSLVAQILIDVSEVRNMFSAHNSKLKLSQNDKNSSIDTLKRLLQDPDIATTKKAKTALEQLNSIQTSDHIIQDILDANTKQIVVRLIDSDIEDIEQRRGHDLLSVENANDADDNGAAAIAANEDEYPDERALEYIRTRRNQLCASHSNNSAFSFRRLFKIAILIAMLSVVINLIAPYWKDNKYLEGKESELNRKPNCLHLYNNEGIFTEWDFHYDIENIYNESIVERKWFSNILYERMKSSKNGVLIASDIGFGKSCIVSLLVCSPEESSWYKFRKNLLVYHMCRYDVETTKQPHIFVRNLASMLMSRYRGFHSAVINDASTESFLFGPHCKNDPIGCLESIVLRPLKKTWKAPLNESESLIVLDAADECCLANRKMDIVTLISYRLLQFPKSFKFVITTRDLLALKNALIGLDHLELQSFSTDISADLKDYALARRNEGDIKDADIDNIIIMSEGNFLLLRFLMDNYFRYGQSSLNNKPTTLFQFYTNNLKRIFGRDGENFNLAKELFEIIYTSTDPLYLEDIYSILNEPERIEKRALMLYLRNEMRHFLQFSNESFTLLHKSIIEFFESLSEESTFYIDMKSGHERIAKYLMKDLAPETWIQTAFHVQKSESDKLLRDLAIMSAELNVENLTVVSVVSTIDSFEIMEIYADIAPPFDVELKDIPVGNMNDSLAFIASKFGHVHTLHWLVENGANVRFAKPTYFECSYFYTKSRFRYVSGYILLDIASRGGHVSVVKFVLEKDITITDPHSLPFSMTAFDVACRKWF